MLGSFEEIYLIKCFVESKVQNIMYNALKKYINQTVYILILAKYKFFSKKNTFLSKHLMVYNLNFFLSRP